METNFVGRENEIYEIEKIINSNKPELVSMIGKRRIGKTTLIKRSINFFKNKNNNVFSFYFTGQYGLEKNKIKKYLNKELLNYIKNSEFNYLVDETKIKKNKYSSLLNLNPKDFINFFSNLKILFNQIKEKYGEQFKFIVYFDEVSWLEGKNISKNGFKNAFSLYWNDFFAYEKAVKMFITSSATQWIVENFLNDKGGFHGRLTKKINLKPFTLQENYDYLKQNINKDISKKESILYYMAFGGVAYYLSLCQKDHTFEENVKFLFKDGVLKNEYDNLFRSIFNKELHKKIITKLAKAKSVGLKAEDFIEFGSISEIRKALNDLTLSSFVKERKFFNQIGKEKYYYLNDIFSYFHNSFISKKKMSFSINDHDFKIWSGIAFELVMLNQVEVIKKAGGFLDVETEEYCWSKKNDEGDGAQIDLVIERKDKKIHLIEIKFRDMYIFDEEEANNIKNKYQQFIKEKQHLNKINNYQFEFILVLLDKVKFEVENELINRKRKIVKITEEIN